MPQGRRDDKGATSSLASTFPDVILELGSVMENVIRIPIPLRHIGSVNAWLLRGDPVTLIDTGPREDEALGALEAGLAREGLRVEDIELVLVTHHHLDHSGLAATIARRSGARIGAYERAAAYGRDYDERTDADRRFSLALMRHHGVPDQVIADNEDFWDFIRRTSEAYDADVVLADGASVRAGGRDLRVVARPGHSTTDALFVDERDAIAFVGDHLLAGISSNTEVYPVARARRYAAAGARGVPREPAPHRRDAARSAADRARRRGDRPRRPRPPAAGGPRTALWPHRRSAPRRPRERLRDRHPPVAGRDRRRTAAARRLGGARAPRPVCSTPAASRST